MIWTAIITRLDGQNHYVTFAGSNDYNEALSHAESMILEKLLKEPSYKLAKEMTSALSEEDAEEYLSEVKKNLWRTGGEVLCLIRGNHEVLFVNRNGI